MTSFRNSKKELFLDTKKMHHDILSRLNKINKPQRYLCEKLGIGRATLHRLSKGHELKVDTFLKLLNWMDVDINSYIKIK